MSSKRKAIREAVVAALTGNTAAGTKIYNSRSTNFWGITPPAIAVYTRSESSEPQYAGAAPPLIRTLELVIECVVAGAGDSLENALDDLVDQVEAALKVPDDLGGAYQWALVQTETDAAIDGERVLGVAALTYEFKYTA